MGWIPPLTEKQGNFQIFVFELLKRVCQKKLEDNHLIYMPQHQSFIQHEVTAVITWASDGSSLAPEMFQALCCFTAA